MPEAFKGRASIAARLPGGISTGQEACFSMWSGGADKEQDEEKAGGGTKKTESGRQEIL